MKEIPSASACSWRTRWLLSGAVVALLAIVVVWWWLSSRPGNGDDSQAVVVDPRLTYPTPYRNVRPEVKYVGDQVCAECHLNHVKTYRHHPMGRALAPLAEASAIERYDEPAKNPFTALGLQYEIQRRNDRVVHRERAVSAEGKTLAEIEAPVQFAVGSGTRARSYIVNFDGFLFQSPATWYPGGKRWDLSPGYEERNLHFHRPITPSCLFCHCNYAEHVPGTVNRYKEPIFHGYAIGCERCHGPGELHVQRRETGERVKDLDDTIVNPGRLEPSLREAVCQQCHMQGEQRVVCRGRVDFDYRPGLPLHLFVMDFADARNRRGDFKFVSSVEQMMASRCYRESREPKKLGCILCHDPHKHPEEHEKAAHYRGRCLQCHTDKSCRESLTARREKNDSCIACHMPPIGSEVRHTAITDHRVPRRAEKPATPPKRSTPGPDDLVPFHRDLLDPHDEEVSRNLGVALMGMLDVGPPEAAARAYTEKALPRLERAHKRDKRDVAVAEARADALGRLGRHEQALAAYEAILAQKPDFESTLHGAGYVALAMNRPDAARAYLERAVRVNPWNWHYHVGLARASFRKGEWDRAIRECQASLRLEATNPSTRSLLVQCYLCLGYRDKAQAEFEILRHLTPHDRRHELRLWFEEQQRRFGR